MWTLALAAVGAVFATLLMPPALLGIFDERIGTAGFIAGTLLVWTALITAGFSSRPRIFELAVAAGIFAVFLMVFVRASLPERSHLFEFSIVALLIYEALLERRSNGRSVPVPFLVAILATFLLGLIDETLQLFVPHRVFDPEDLLFNLLAAVMAVSGVATLRLARSAMENLYKQR